MIIEEAEKLIFSQRYSIDIEPKNAYIEIITTEKKKIVKKRQKCFILAVAISQNNEIMYLIELNNKRFYKLKSEVYGD
jgi:hypothetical protein